MTERTSADQDTAPVQLGDQKNIGWNFAVNLWDIMFITLGLSLVSRDTVMPVLVSNLTDSKLAIGMIPALVTLGYYLPQLLSANISERMTYKKPFVAIIGFFGERLPYLLIAVSLYFLAVDAPLASLFIFFLCIGVASSSAGFGTPAWFDMIAKVIPVERRGIWSGLGHGLGAVISVAALYLVALPIMQRTAYPANFALLFTLAFVAMAVSWVGLVLTREPPTQIVKASMASTVYFRQLPQLLAPRRQLQAFPHQPQHGPVGDHGQRVLHRLRHGRVLNRCVRSRGAYDCVGLCCRGHEPRLGRRRRPPGTQTCVDVGGILP